MVPVSIDGQKKVKGSTFRKQARDRYDSSGRRTYRVVQGSDEQLPFDIVVIAVSQYSDLPFISKEEVDISRWGNIVVDENGMVTRMPGVFAGGDLVRGPDTVINAIADGKQAARAIDRYLGERANSSPEMKLEIPNCRNRFRILSITIAFEMKYLERKNELTTSGSVWAS